ncbi:hypothetical protein ACPZ19_51055 [Amycolatopsis lurida]
MATRTALDQSAEHGPGHLRRLDREGLPAPPHQRRDAVHQWLPVVGQALVQDAPHGHVGIARFGVRGRCRALLGRVQQPVLRPPGAVGSRLGEVDADGVTSARTAR